MSLVIPGGFFAGAAGAAQPVFRSSVHKAYNDSSMAKPAGVADGDGLFFFGNAYYDTEAESPESHGWTKVIPLEGETGAWRMVYHRVASGEPPDYNSQFGHYSFGILVSYQGFGSISAIGGWQTAGGNERTFNAPVGAGRLIAYTHGDSPYATYTFPAGMVLRTQYWAPNLCDQSNGGNGGARTWLSSIAADIWCFMMTIQG